MPRYALTRLVSFVALLVLSSTITRAATPVELDAERIKAGLRTTEIEEDGFVDRALRLVEEGKLSAATVQSTFVWARKKSVHKFQHFRYGLLERTPNAAVRRELATGQAPAPPEPTPSLGQRVVARIRRLFSFLPSVHALLK